MPKYHLRNVELLLLVHDHRYTLSIVPDLDKSFGWVNRDLNLRDPFWIPLDVVNRVYDDLIEYLV